MGDNPEEVVVKTAEKIKLSDRINELKRYVSADKKRAIILGFITLAIPITVVLALTQQDLFLRAAGIPNTPATPPWPTDSKPTPTPTFSTDIDPQTHERYDIQITSDVDLVKNSNPGPLYSYRTTFSILGSRINSLSSLYGFREKPDGTSDPITFNFNPNSPTRFISNPIDLGYGNCIDLNSSSTNDKATYVATFCFKNYDVSPNSNGVAYSINSDPFFNYSYSGSKPTIIQTLSTAHDRYKYPNPNGWTLGNFHRVSYFTIDSRKSSLSDFKNVQYYINAITYGLNNVDYARICDFPTPAKYLKQSFGVKPEGGNNYPITNGGNCSFTYNSNRLFPGFISLDMQGGLPTPIPSPAISPTPAPLKMTLNVAADAFVRSSSPNSNFGTSTSMEVDSNPNEISYLKFNLINLAGKTIVSAKLRLKVSDSSAKLLNLRRGSNVDWSETGITYNNRPGFDATIRSFNATAANSIIELDVKNAVSLRKGGKLYLGITSTGDDTGAFYSRESASSNRPQLVVEYR